MSVPTLTHSNRPPMGALAVAQTCPVAGDVSANVDEHLRLARAAIEAGARLIVFPELSLTGYELPRARELAFAPEDARLEPLRDLAAGAGATLIVGAPLLEAGRLHLAAFVLSPDRAVAHYTKRRLGTFPPAAACDAVDGSTSLPPPEPTVFEPGTRDPLIAHGRRTAAIAICADIGDPDHPAQASARGAGIYLASMFVIPSDFAGESAALSRYATRHRMVVALANFGGPSGGLRAAGRSGFWRPDGTLGNQLAPEGAGFALWVEDRV